MFEQVYKTQILNAEVSSIVVKNDEIKTSNKRGVAPINDIIERDKTFLNGAVAYDTVIGKAAAMLLVNNKVKALFAGVISKHAYDYLVEHEVYVEYNQCVSHIINRTGDGMCPLESAVLELSDHNKAYDIIKSTIKVLMSRN